MNYQRVYDQLIARAKQRSSVQGYTETHHITPRSLGGGNSQSNLVELTAREHFLAHWLLCKIYPDSNKLAYAFWGMCNQSSSKQKERYIPSTRVYQESRERFAKVHSIIHSQYTHSEESKEKISKKLLGKPKSEQARKNMSIAALQRSAEHKAKIGATKKGKPRSEETRRKISEALKKRASQLEN